MFKLRFLPKLGEDLTTYQGLKVLDPVSSTGRYEVMKLCTGSVQDSNGWYLVVLGHFEAVPVCN